MFITKRHIRRRTFLQGAGATLALPLLDAMVPAGELLAQTAANPKTRFVGIFFPHGMAPGHWEPAAEGALPEKLPYILESLEKVKDQTVGAERPLVAVGRAARGDDRFRSLGGRRVPHRHQAAQDGRAPTRPPAARPSIR